MSWVALGWASKQRPGKIADKLVLIGLADRHNDEDDMAWPSIAWMCEFTGADRKTVITSLSRLEASGLISDSGKRFGRTGQIKGYRLAINSAEKGVPKTEPLNSKSPVFPVKESQKRDTEPFMEPNTSEANASSVARSRETEIPDGWTPDPFDIGSKSRTIVDGWPDGAADFQLEKFRAHHGARGSRFKNWQKAWSTWVLNSKEFSNGRTNRVNSPSGAATGTRVDGFLAACREVGDRQPARDPGWEDDSRRSADTPLLGFIAPGQ